MATSIDLQKLFTEFNRIAFASSSDGLAQLSSPGVEGLQIFLASGVDEIPVGVDEVRSGYQAKGWVENRSLTWSDVVSMVEYLMNLQLQKAVQIQVDSRVGDTCPFGGCLVSCEDEVRAIDDDGLFTSAERRMIASMKKITVHRDHGLRLLLMASWDLERATDLSLVIGPSAVETEQVAVEEHPPLGLAAGASVAAPPSRVPGSEPCRVCMDTPPVVLETTCGHLFCSECRTAMEASGHGWCPLCRTTLAWQDSMTDPAWLGFLVLRAPTVTRERGLHQCCWPVLEARLGKRANAFRGSGFYVRRVMSEREARRWWALEGLRWPPPRR